MLTEGPHRTRLFLKTGVPGKLACWGGSKSRTSLPSPVQSRSENALNSRSSGTNKGTNLPTTLGREIGVTEIEVRQKIVIGLRSGRSSGIFHSSRIASGISRWAVTRSRVFSLRRAHGHPGLEGGDPAKPSALSKPTRDEWHPEFESVPQETAVAHDR